MNRTLSLLIILSVSCGGSETEIDDTRIREEGESQSDNDAPSSPASGVGSPNDVPSTASPASDPDFSDDGPSSPDSDLDSSDDAPKRPLLPGSITANEGNWISGELSGVLAISPESGSFSRFLNGHDAWRSSSGDVVFLEFCGPNEANRVVMTDAQGLNHRVLLTCSSGTSSDYFDREVFKTPQLSPKGRYLSVVHYAPSRDQWGFAVYDVVDDDFVGSYLGFTPTWTRDGRLVFGSGSGLMIGNYSLTDVEAIAPEQLRGEVWSPNIHPFEDRLLFVFNQQVWEINLDGSGLHQAANGNVRMFSPVYSPDGNSFAYIGQLSAGTVDIYVVTGNDEPRALGMPNKIGRPKIVNAPLDWAD